MTHPHRKSGPQNGLLISAATVLLVLSLVPYLHGIWWPLELPAHFRPHLAAAAVVVALLAAMRKQPYAMASGCIVLAVSSLVFLSVPTGHASDQQGIIIVSQNLYHANGHADRLLAIIDEEDPDILVLQEYTPAWHALLSELGDRYETTIAVPQNGAFGIAVFSKLPVENSEVLYPGGDGIPFISAEFSTPRFSGRLVAVHFSPPTRRGWLRARNRQLAGLAAHVQELSGPFVIVGDFNNTPAAPTLRRFLGSTNTHLAAPSWLATWPSSLGFAGIPIDLAIGSRNVRFSGLSTLGSVGSDHRGISVSVAPSI